MYTFFLFIFALTRYYRRTFALTKFSLSVSKSACFSDSIGIWLKAVQRLEDGKKSTLNQSSQSRGDTGNIAYHNNKQTPAECAPAHEGI